MKKFDKTIAITTLCCILPMAMGAVLYHKMPAQVPIHWGVNGQPDGYASRAFAVYGMPVLMAALNLFLRLFADNDPKRQNVSPTLRNITYWIIPGISLILFPVTFLWATGVELRIELIVPLALGLLFIAIGNYLPKCKQNYTMGIKLPWTLASEENWNRTHRLAGYLFILGGVCMALGGVLQSLWLGLFPILLAAVIPAVYSYLLYKRGI